MGELGRTQNGELIFFLALGGVGCGLAETLYLWPSFPEVGSRSILVLLVLSAALMGLVGCAWGIVLSIIRGLANRSSSRVLAVAAIVALAVFPYSGERRWIAAAAGALALAAVARWSNVRLATTMMLWPGLIGILHPLFNGTAMVQVFSASEVTVVFVAVLAVTLLLAASISSLLQPAPSASLLAMASAIAAGAGAIALTVLGSIFLVRLWGFHTMQYLQLVLLIVKIALAAIAARFFVTLGLRWSAGPHVTVGRQASLFTGLGLLLAFVFCAYVALPADAAARSVLARLPDSSLLANGIAARLDRDRDGYSTIFGFGDCDDDDPNVNPASIDWPGNGVDENCLGGDLRERHHDYFSRPVDLTLQPREDRRRRIAFLVVIDTLRADAVDYRTTAASETPNLAALAARGVRFDRAYSQSNNTLESFPFLLHVGFRNLPRHEPKWALPALLRAAGVRTSGVYQSSTNWWHSNLDEVFLGFDRRLSPDGEDRNRSAEATVEEALAEAATAAPDDLFVMVHFEALHDFFTQRMEGDRMIDQGLNVSELIRLWDLPGMRALALERYASVLKRIDEALAEFISGVDVLREDADVLVILTSDHGEEFLEHNGLFHMGTLYEEVIRVPLLVGASGVEARTESESVGLYRVPATILDWFGVRGSFVSALSLLTEPVTPLPIFAYFSTKADWIYRTFMLIEDPYKLIYDSAAGRLQLFHLERDPMEHDDLILSGGDVAARRQLTEGMDTLMYYMNYGDIERPPVPPTAAR
jgi:hypothetical protein